MFRIGVLGLGTMGKRHLEAAASLPGIEMITREHASFAGIKDAMALGHAMIADPAIDAIDICLPTAFHAPLTIAALAANKHVLCEKPMALHYADCARMLAAKQQSKATLMVAHVLRFWPAYEVLREAVLGGSYGPIVSATLTRKSGKPTWAPWLLRPEESGGGILDMLVHDFDQTLLLFGAPLAVTGDSGGSPDALACSLRYPGFEVRIEGGWLPGDVSFGMGFAVEAERGSLRFANDVLEGVELGTADPYAAQLVYFVECCREGKAPKLCPPESSAQAVALACTVRDLVMKGSADAAISLPGGTI